MADLKSRSYDKFEISLQRLQLIYAVSGEDWKGARNQSNSNMQVLQPFDLNIQLHKGLIVDDPRLPKIRILGDLPNLTINISDYKLQQIACLATSIPTPESSPPPPEQPFDDTPAAVVDEAKNNASRLVKKGAAVKQEGDKPSEQLTDLELKFELKQFSVNICKRVNTHDVGLLCFTIEGIGTELKIRTYDMTVGAFIGGIALQHLQFNALDGSPVTLLGTPAMGKEELHLVVATYTKVNRKCPEFSTTYNNTEQKVQVNFSTLDILLHQGALLHLMEFGKEFGKKMAAVEKAKPSSTIKAVADESKEAMVAMKPATSKSIIGLQISEERKRRMEEIIDLKLEANLDTIGIGMCNDQRMITELKIKGLNAGVTMQKEKIGVSTVLKDIIVTDPTPNAIHPKILSILGGELFNVHLTQYTNATAGDNYSNMEAVDTQIDLTLGQICVVFLNKYVADVVQFAEAFQSEEAKKAIADASSAAAESAAEAAASMHEKASRVQLNINMNAPVIIVPQNSKSAEALVADLGYLTICNRFVLTGATNEVGMPSILDKMMIELNKLQLSRAKMDPKTDCTQAVAECLVIEPVNFSIELRRNLCISWYKEIPEIDVSGQLTTLNMTMSQEDFTFLMKVLNENLKEGPTSAPALKPQPELTQHELIVKSVVPDKVEPATEAKPEPVKTPQTPSTSDEPAYEKVSFKFQFDNLGFALYTGSSCLSSGHSAREPTKALAKFELQVITAEGVVKSNNVISAKVGLFNVIMDDMREGREVGINRLMEARAAAALGNHSHRMIDFSFDQAPTLDKKVDISIRSFYICMVMDYLLTVADFFTKGLPAVTDVPPQPSSKATTSKPTTASGEPEIPTSSLELKFLMEKPEIALVENAMNKDTRALVVSTDVTFGMCITPEVQQMNGTVEQLQVII